MVSVDGPAYPNSVCSAVGEAMVEIHDIDDSVYIDCLLFSLLVSQPIGGGVVRSVFFNLFFEAEPFARIFDCSRNLVR